MWDLLIILILIIQAFITPLRVAFESYENIALTGLLNIFDILFLIDSILTFFTSYGEPVTNQEITDLKKIAVNYLKNWFIVDIVSIFPFEYLLESVGRVNQLLRIIRLSKLLRLIRMIRLARAYKSLM